MSTTLAFVDYHTCGEPVRIVTGGYPDLPGATILDKRRAAKAQHDHLRRAMMLEPRGHAGMYGVIPVASHLPEAAFGVLFTHNEGYSTMCGHATIALGRYAIESGIVPVAGDVTRFAIEAPCGLVRIEVETPSGQPGAVKFLSVPAFAAQTGLSLTMPDGRAITCDLAYGGAYYLIVPAQQFGLDFETATVAELVRLGTELTRIGRETLAISHPGDADLGFLYGTIITDGAPPDQPSRNLCIFAEGQIDRSPTGSGVTARMALDLAKGLVAPGQMRRFISVTGGVFTAEVVAQSPEGVIVEVGGRSHLMGRGEFIIEAEDGLGLGFDLPVRFPAGPQI